MKKVMMISLLALSMTASAKGWPVDTLHQASVNNPFLQRLTPTLTTDYVQVGKINQHWFFGIQGGASAFIGKPLGCGDFFDRTAPSFNAYLGKWFTPNVGARVSFQGLKYKNSDLEKMSYQLAHADLMYNIANLFRSPSESMPHVTMSAKGSSCLENLEVFLRSVSLTGTATVASWVTICSPCRWVSV